MLPNLHSHWDHFVSWVKALPAHDFNDYAFGVSMLFIALMIGVSSIGYLFKNYGHVHHHDSDY